MSRIEVVGLGPGSVGDLSLGVRRKLQQAESVFLRTEKHPVVQNFADWGIQYISFDHYYQELNKFEEVYQAIVDHLFREASCKGEVIYAVPGSPLVAEASVALLKEQSIQQGVSLKISPALSFLDALYARLDIDPTDGLHILDALASPYKHLNTNWGLLICQVYHHLAVSDLKLDLLEYYPPDHQIIVLRAAGIKGMEKLVHIPLYQLDHLTWLDHLTSVYLPPFNQHQHTLVADDCLFPLDPLAQVLDQLLGPHGCPWDKRQDHQSLKSCLIEECYEVLEAIDNHDADNLCEELGDLLLQIVFHSKLAEGAGYFDLNQVVQGITEKMIRRHPHIFGNISVDGEAEVLENWEMIKAQEKGNTVDRGILDQVSRGMPALLQAYKIQQKAAQVGFDWPDIQGPWDKIDEEITELKEALELNHGDRIRSELGDVLFAMINLARYLGITPEDALLSTIRRFRSRFAFIEKQVQKKGGLIQEMTLEELDTLWELAKKEEA